jgi:hypothetical protein
LWRRDAAKRAEAEEATGFDREAGRQKANARQAEDKQNSNAERLREFFEQFKRRGERFDKTHYNPLNPLTFKTVPWPVLPPSNSLAVQHKDVTWDTVEKFFCAAKKCLEATDLRTLIQENHRRFHPDRWSARGLLKTVADEVSRKSLEDAAKIVAQALTPLRKET